jgi:hypothetical protein
VCCSLTIDPTDANDIVLANSLPSSALTAPTSPVPSSFAFSRSFDGGVTWQSWSLPPDPGGNDQGGISFEGFEWTWSSSSLYVAACARCDSYAPIHRVAVSVQRHPLSWVQQQALFGDAEGVRFGGMVASGGSLYVRIVDSYKCEPNPLCYHWMKTSDNGSSWSGVALAMRGQSVSMLPQEASDGRSLFGAVLDSADPNGQERTYVRTTNGGQSWRKLAAPPGGAIVSGGLVISSLAQAPDGAIYAVLYRLYRYPSRSQDATPEGIYVLAPGAATWRFVAPYRLPYEIGQIILSWDRQGHAEALWSL